MSGDCDSYVFVKGIFFTMKKTKNLTVEGLKKLVRKIIKEEKNDNDVPRSVGHIKTGMVFLTPNGDEITVAKKTPSEAENDAVPIAGGFCVNVMTTDGRKLTIFSPRAYKEHSAQIQRIHAKYGPSRKDFFEDIYFDFSKLKFIST